MPSLPVAKKFTECSFREDFHYICHKRIHLEQGWQKRDPICDPLKEIDWAAVVYNILRYR